VRRDAFLKRYGAVYEASPWVAEEVWPGVEAGEIADVAALQAAMRKAVDARPREERLALVRAHPELAGRTKIVDLAAASKAEQSGAGLDQCTPAEFAAFQELNGAYNARFGFPFIIAVKGLDRGEILEAFKTRLSNPPFEEFDTAMNQIHRIAGLRLEALGFGEDLSTLASDYLNLAQPRLGAEVVYATDDFFADKARLIDPAEPRFVPGLYDDNGKWMDGWESRRKRTPGHDWAIIRLHAPSEIAGFEIDTRHFTGNYPPRCSIEGCRSDEPVPGDGAAWTTLVPVMDLNGDDRRLVAAAGSGLFTHVRLSIYPDGGVARLRVFGRVHVDWDQVAPDEIVDLLAMENGGRGLFANDEHFGKVENLTAPGRGKDMGDGWETRRRREPGHDWAVLMLGHEGRVDHLIVDTAHFKGNYPDRCSVQATWDDSGEREGLEERSAAWPVLLPEVKLQADHVHRFDNLADLGPVNFVRLNIYPDGGVSRLRVMGRKA
jgi:allantoicase